MCKYLMYIFIKFINNIKVQLKLHFCTEVKAKCFYSNE